MKKILKIKGLKYWIAAAVFLLVILFIDPNNLLVTRRLHRQVSQLHREEAQLKADIQADSAANAQLLDNPDAIEHYARENYYMKRPNEDIFVVK
ncbi:MAG: septum formation initiator family protein [Bacteroidales bacterium]|nr:septum formation initiator family protein [Bacteroidales bacterium]